MIPLRFVSRYGTYTFPVGMTQEFSPRFGGIAAQTIRLPGTDGGFDQYGDGLAPGEVGSVRVVFGLVDDAGTDLDAQRDAVMAMAGWGKGMLVAQPAISGGAERFCWARVNNITIYERESDLNQVIQAVTVDFQANSPRWYVNRFGVVRWGFRDAAWGGGGYWGGTAAPQACAGALTVLSLITNSGTALALPRIQISLAAGQSAEDITIERIVGGISVEDQISIAGTLVAGDIVYIDCKGASVQKNYADAYSLLSYQYPSWMTLWPGANVLQVRMSNASDACSVRISYEDTYL